MSTALAVLGGVVTLFLGSDAIHSGWTHYQLNKWEEQVERYSDGVRKGWREFSAGEGETALLLVHGFGTGPSLYEDMTPLLSEKGLHCKALRLPGFGVPMAKSRRVEAKDWVAEIHRNVQQLAGAHEQVWIVAHSLGGAVTLDYLLNEHPEAPVDGLVLLAPAVEVSSERSPLVSPRQWFGFWDRYLLFTDVIKNDLPVQANDPRVKDKLKRSKFVPQNIFEQMFEVIGDVTDGSRGLNMPVLLVLAENDEVIANARAKRFYENLKTPRRKLIRLENSHHIIPFDSGMERTVRAIGKFVRKPKNFTPKHQP